jgi:hypothetical protein
MTTRVTLITLLIATTAAGTLPARAATDSSRPQGHLGAVLELDGDFGGDDIARVFYTNGTTQTIKAGQGITGAVGLHYQLATLPLDVAVTAGYKYVTTRASNANIYLDRIEIKALGTYELANHCWVDAGPVWHAGTRLHGAGYLPNISFDDAIGATVGFGWRWIGIAYTNIHYSSPLTGNVDASNVGVTLAWKF